jgi:hypothetical protein
MTELNFLGHLIDMPRHEKFTINDELCVTRVPGGWIYEVFSGGDWSTVFVPLTNCF